ncbi:hypothetical protein K439DRAFT_1556900 [Ramaria rubella]|nr:hypothetical protein K439DRAFT_1556900 [Ramaria rubella]
MGLAKIGTHGCCDIVVRGRRDSAVGHTCYKGNKFVMDSKYSTPGKYKSCAWLCQGPQASAATKIDKSQQVFARIDLQIAKSPTRSAQWGFSLGMISKTTPTPPKSAPSQQGSHDIRKEEAQDLPRPFDDYIRNRKAEVLYSQRARAAPLKPRPLALEGLQARALFDSHLGADGATSPAPHAPPPYHTSPHHPPHQPTSTPLRSSNSPASPRPPESAADAALPSRVPSGVPPPSPKPQAQAKPNSRKCTCRAVCLSTVQPDNLNSVRASASMDHPQSEGFFPLDAWLRRDSA